MQKRALSGTNWGAVRIVALYLSIGGLWILFSDRLLATLVNDQATFSNVSILKGWAYIVVTSLCLYWLIQRHTAALETSQERLRLAYDAGEFGTWRHDLEADLVTFDRRACAHFGLTTSTLSLDEFLTHVHPDDVAYIRQRWAEALSPHKDGKYEAEYRAIHRDGTVHWVGIRGRVYFEGKGETRHPILGVGTTQDITTRKQADEILQRYQLLAQSTRDIVLFVRRDGKILDANRAALTTYGYSHAELLGLSIYDLRSQDVPAVVEKQMALADSDGILFEAMHQRKDGSRFPVEVSSRGTTIGGVRTILSVVRDISERKEAERALAVSEEKYRTLVEAADDAILLTDPQGRHLFANSAYYTSLGYEMGFDPNPDGFSNIHSEDAVNLVGRLPELLTKGSGTAEYRARHKDGHWVYRYAKSSVIYGDSGEPKAILSIVRDITDRKIAEESLREREAKLSALFTILPVGVAILDHDRRIVETNPAQEKIQKLTREELLAGAYQNRKYKDKTGALIPVHAYPSSIAIREQCVVLDTEMGIVLEGDTPTIWTNVSAAPLPDGGAVVVTTDITARKQAERTIFESEQRFSKAFHSSPVSMVISRASDGAFIDANTAFTALTGFTREQTVGHLSSELAILDPETEAAIAADLVEHRTLRNLQTTVRHQSGEMREILLSVETIELNEELCIIATAIDLTERIRAERASRASQERFAKIFHSSPTGINLFGLDDRRSRDVNNAYLEMIGYSREEVIGHTADELHLLVSVDNSRDWIAVLREHGAIRSRETQIRRKSGELRDMLVSIDAMELDGELMGLVFASDITERKWAEQALRESEERYRLISTVASDYMFSTHVEANGTLRHDWIGGAFERITGYSVQEYRARGGWRTIVHPDDLAQDHADMQTLRANMPIVSELRIIKKGGQVVWVRSFGHPVLDETNHRLIGIYGGVQDITERKLAEEEIRYQANLLANVSDAIISTDMDFRIKSWNRAAETIYGWSATEAFGQVFAKLVPVEFLDSSFEASLEHLTTRGHWEGITRQATASGTKRVIASSVTLIRDHTRQPTGSVAVNRDITEINQQQRELEAIALLSSALRTAAQRADMLAIVLDRVGKSLDVKVAVFLRHDALTGEFELETIHGDVNQALRSRMAEGIQLAARAILTGEPYLENNLLKEMPGEAPFPGNLRAVACVPFIAQHQPIGVLWVARDEPITESELRILVAIADIAANAIYRAQLYTKTEQQLDRIETLHTIETAIASSFDLKLTLNLILEQVTTRLDMDAAAIYLYSPSWLNLEYAAGRGFRYPPQYASLRLGEGLAGRAVLEREIISVPNLADALSGNSRLTIFNIAAEDLVSYCGVPLIMKGQVKGVLELYARAPMPQDPEWDDYIKTLAQQTAIAIDNLEMFNNLQRSNLELGLAYDATIEGWSHALDLRDKETEGHTLRVTELTTRLARAFHIGESDIVHLRRGALLHDIGKMGVPDTILLKPDTLTEEERASMRKHPEYAFQMLSPIAYLRPALDIPHYHHEKWDGTGYPNGLAGEQIPLAARLFAVVDVWDALTSDRPYRAAWSAERARSYILEQRGKHFDPQVVDKFLEIIQSPEQTDRGEG